MSEKSLALTRTLRSKKARKVYSNDWIFSSDSDGDDSNYIITYSISSKFLNFQSSQNFVEKLDGNAFNMAYLQTHGFSVPLLFKEKAGLYMEVPDQTFSVKDVHLCVGSHHILDVIDVPTQKSIKMTMKDWLTYYDNPIREKLLEVTSLEFSHTRLESYVKRPGIVRLIDWVDCVWPKYLKGDKHNSEVPQVQKYCIMSVKECFTDFHIEFGGSSVWYHVSKGSKMIWLIPPTENNIQCYEHWVLSGKQGDSFFGDLVKICDRIVLSEGSTLFVPAGWIHAMYTSEDSLMFGGNFLHSFDIETQLRIAQLEHAMKVPSRCRFPDFNKLLWYVMEHYVYCVFGKSYLSDNSVEEHNNTVKSTEHMHITRYELNGLTAIIEYMMKLPHNKKDFPNLLSDPVMIMKDVQKIIELHRNDDTELAITGKPVLLPQVGKYRRWNQKSAVQKNDAQTERKKREHPHLSLKMRRARCSKCQACKESNCDKCVYCLDMIKNGGPGKMKQTCLMRRCTAPKLSRLALCCICKLDGWGNEETSPLHCKNVPSSLMECRSCFEIHHPDCLAQKISGLKGKLIEKLPNSWLCPKCCKNGIKYQEKFSQWKSKNFRITYRKPKKYSRHLETEINDLEALSASHLGPIYTSNTKKRTGKVPVESFDSIDRNDDTIKTCVSPELVTEQTFSEEPISTPESRSLALRKQLANAANTIKAVIRSPCPAPLTVCANKFVIEESPSNLPAYMTTRENLLHVFKWLTPNDLSTCALVCKTWANFSVHNSLWKEINLSGQRLTSTHLTYIIRRQPEILILDWTMVAKKQLEWLIVELPQLRELSLQGCKLNGVSALKTGNCPPLTALDLSHVDGMNDSAFCHILFCPANKFKLKDLKSLNLSGCEVSDASLQYIGQNLSNLSSLDLSRCHKITDTSILHLMNSETVLNALARLNLNGCSLITDASLNYFSMCKNLKQLDLRFTSQITFEAMKNFLITNKEFSVMEYKLLMKD